MRKNVRRQLPPKNKPLTEQTCYMRKLPGVFCKRTMYTAFTLDGIINVTVNAADRVSAKAALWKIYHFDIKFFR
jgi:hypothetical protein